MEVDCLPFAGEIPRGLRDDGTFVLYMGGSYDEGKPARSLDHFQLLIALVEEVGFHIAQECFWYNPAKTPMPMPAEWLPFAESESRILASMYGGCRRRPGLKRATCAC
jgi:hypothetical protein